MLAKHPMIVHDHDSPRQSPRIQVVDVASGALRPVAHTDWLVLASDQAPWRDSLLVEQHRRPPFEGSEHAPHAHHISIRLSPPSLMDWWIAGERPRRQLIAPGQVHIVPAGVPMWNRWQEPIETLVLALKPAFVQHAVYEAAHPDRCEFMSRRGIRDAQLLYLGQALRAELAGGCLSGQLYGESLATAIAIHLLQRYAVCSPMVRAYRGGLPQAGLRRVLEYMQEYLAQDLSLAELAGMVQMSPYYFSRLFKQSTGLSPHQYILQQRIEWAKRLLAEARLPIAATAYHVGFASQAHFTKIFRQWVGTTPRQYRQQR